jgi:hypothetical protein
MSEQTENGISTIELATELTAAWLGNPNTRADAEAVPARRRRTHRPRPANSMSPP